MIQVVYESEATTALSSGDVFRIVETSSKNNLENDLTGFLIYKDARFFQVLEGPQDAVDALLARLRKDPRHTNIEVLISAPISRRSFPNWRMKRVAASSIASLDEISPNLTKTAPGVRQAAIEFLKDASPKAA